MSLRLWVDQALSPGLDLVLLGGPARHAQVRRVQPGDTLVLFDGAGHDWPAQVLRVGRNEVQVRVAEAQVVQRELAAAVTLALGMPANERMDTLVEKATELGVACIQPLHTERSVLRLQGERAERKREHWQAVAQAACEQCGRARLPLVQPVQDLSGWLASPASNTAGLRLVLSLQPDARPLQTLLQQAAPEAAVLMLSGPEGGLAPHEEAAALRLGFVAAGLGPRVLRADTAPLLALAACALRNPAT